MCRFEAKVIGLSAPLARLHDDREVRDTILHEIAHALAGPAAGHGPAWRDVAARIGCSSRRCLPADAPRVPGAWVGVCSRGHTTERHRRPERVMTCARCSPTFTLEHVLEWAHHGRPGSMHPNYLAELRALRAGESLSLLPVGARARVVAPGEFSGQVGTVLKRGRTSYHIEVPQGVLRVVFAAVQPL